MKFAYSDFFPNISMLFLMGGISAIASTEVERAAYGTRCLKTTFCDTMIYSQCEKYLTHFVQKRSCCGYKLVPRFCWINLWFFRCQTDVTFMQQSLLFSFCALIIVSLVATSSKLNLNRCSFDVELAWSSNIAISLMLKSRRLSYWVCRKHSA